MMQAEAVQPARDVSCDSSVHPRLYPHGIRNLVRARDCCFRPIYRKICPVRTFRISGLVPNQCGFVRYVQRILRVRRQRDFVPVCERVVLQEPYLERHFGRGFGAEVEEILRAAVFSHGSLKKPRFERPQELERAYEVGFAGAVRAYEQVDGGDFNFRLADALESANGDSLDQRRAVELGRCDCGSVLSSHFGVAKARMRG